VSESEEPKYRRARRFLRWVRVDPDDVDSHWEWTGPLDSDGYGIFQLPSGNVRAHRWIYDLWHEGIPGALDIDHLCRMRNCVNPKHLEAVTNDENQRRKAAAKIACVQGHLYVDGSFRIDKDGARRCKICDAEKAARYRARRKDKG
jgi:hypothetical protein